MLIKMFDNHAGLNIDGVYVDLEDVSRIIYQYGLKIV